MIAAMTRARQIGQIGALLLIALVTARAWASPARGSDAPAITLPDLGGQSVSTASLAPRALVLVFGELDHEGVKHACADVAEAMADPRLAGAAVTPILIIAKDAPAASLRDEASKGKFPAVILHDPKREAFGAFRVLVIPTVIVVSGQGKVVHSMPAYLPNAKPQLVEAILTAAGKQTPEQFERAIDPNTPGESREAARADRLVHLGQELARHGMYEMAEARFTEAASLVPGHLGAKLGQADMLARQDRGTDAEPLYRAVLAAQADNVEATLGLATVLVRKGGDEAERGRALVKGVLDKDPKSPRAHYVMGLVQEKGGDAAAASAEFKRAAELLLDR